MSELVPFFDDDEELDDNLLRSIETLLDDNEQNKGGSREKSTPNENERMTRSAPSSPLPQFEPVNGSSFTLGNQVYQKWSTNESGEPPNGGTKRNFARNQFRSASFGKSVRKNPTLPPLQTVRANAEIAQYKAMLDEKATQLLDQYLRLNYASLSAQAQKLGIPLDQYIRNLMVALNSQTFMVPNQPLLFSPVSPVQQPTFMPNFSPQRAFTKPQYNKKN